MNSGPYDSIHGTGCACSGKRYCALCVGTERESMRVGQVRMGDALLGHSCRLFNQEDQKAHSIAQEDEQLGWHASLQGIYGQAQLLANAGGHHRCSAGCSSPMEGVLVVNNFVSPKEEEKLLKAIHAFEWKASQSGRRKQDFGPRVNFKQRKVNLHAFAGLPDYTDFLLEKMAQSNVAKLGAFEPVELCALEYSQERLSSIDFHTDDQWIWGERLISINLLSDSIITLAHSATDSLVFVPLPRRSLLCLSGLERHKWQHGIFPHHIVHTRVVLTLRETTPSFMQGGCHFEEFGRELLSRAKLRLDGSITNI